jgi:hypothetical protein
MFAGGYKEAPTPREDKPICRDRQKRQAVHIEEDYEGRPPAR